MATLDVLSLPEAKAALSNALTSSVDDTEIAEFVTAVSLLFDVEFGPVVARTVTETIEGSAWSVTTSQWPVKAFTTVTEFLSGTPTPLTVDSLTAPPVYGYYAERMPSDPTLYTGRIERRSNGSVTYFGGSTVLEVVYTAGRFDNTAAVAPRWKTAARIALKNLWRMNELSVNTIDPGFDVPAQSFPGFALPNAVMEMLGQERQRVPGIA